MLAPAAAAEGGALTADAAKYRGGSRQDGDLSALLLVDDVVVEAPLQGAPQARPSTPYIDLQAERMEAVLIEQRTYVGPQQVGPNTIPTVPVQDPTALEPDVTQLTLAQVHATLTTHQAGFQVHVLALDGARFTAQTEAGAYDPFDAVYIGDSDFKQRPDELDAVGQDPESPNFWGVSFDAPHVAHREDSGRFGVTIVGDLVLEMTGITLHAAGADGEADLASGSWRESVAGSPVDAKRDVLARLFLQGATLRISTVGGEPLAQWASRGLDAVVDGEATLEGATGTLASDGEVLELRDQTYVVAAGNALRLDPGEGTLAMSVAPAPNAQAATPVRDGEAPALLVAIGAVLALLAAMALGLLRRATTAPDLRSVEAAIEAGRYARAARMAGRILRARPGLEDAVLGRAIALSRAGRSARAVAVVQEQLATRGASDGSLHYVLGLALLDLGRKDEARAALAEAVRRTPALEADVAARLGATAAALAGAAADSASTQREVNGYA